MTKIELQEKIRDANTTLAELKESINTHRGRASTAVKYLADIEKDLKTAKMAFAFHQDHDGELNLALDSRKLEKEKLEKAQKKTAKIQKEIATLETKIEENAKKLEKAEKQYKQTEELLGRAEALKKMHLDEVEKLVKRKTKMEELRDEYQVRLDALNNNS